MSTVSPASPLPVYVPLPASAGAPVPRRTRLHAMGTIHIHNPLRHLLHGPILCFDRIRLARLFGAGLMWGLMWALPLTGQAQPVQDPNQIRDAVQVYLQEQTTGMAGEVHTLIGNIDPRLTLGQCDAPQPFLPKGGRLWGKTTLGVRCLSPVTWTMYVQVQVQVLGEYIVSARQLAPGQTLGAEHLTKVKGELNNLPSGIVTDMTQAIGQNINTSLPAGAPIRLDALRKPQIIAAGQSVRVFSSGPGFKVSIEGRAIVGASEGQAVQVKTPGGQQVSGIAKAAGVVEVVN